MGKRDMKQTARKLYDLITRKHYGYLSAYMMDADEMTELMELCETDRFKAVDTAYCYGFVLGQRATRKNRLPVL